MTQNILVFDVGANIGDKAARFAAHAARVVCFEPVPECVAKLRSRFKEYPAITIEPYALGPAPGTLPLSVCSAATTISTFSDAWKNGRFSEHVWDKTIEVPVRTLDDVIAEFGLPDYCKIDVEGFELSVLRGLSKRIPVLSFEFCSEGLSQTAECLAHLESLGYRRFNIVYGECDAMRYVHWLPSSIVIKELREHPIADIWGDIYTAESSAPSEAVTALLPRFSVESDTLDRLMRRGIIPSNAPVRLHLACGDRLLSGYTNIDGFSDDVCGHIANLSFPQASVDEIRVRDILKRFDRLTALRLLIRFELWLKPGCLLTIETDGREHVVMRRKLGNLRSLLQCCAVALSVKP
jgi:FkbM family methyltransferase